MNSCNKIENQTRENNSNKGMTGASDNGKKDNSEKSLEIEQMIMVGVGLSLFQQLRCDCYGVKGELEVIKEKNDSKGPLLNYLPFDFILNNGNGMKSKYIKLSKDFEKDFENFFQEIRCAKETLNQLCNILIFNPIGPHKNWCEPKEVFKNEVLRLAYYEDVENENECINTTFLNLLTNFVGRSEIIMNCLNYFYLRIACDKIDILDSSVCNGSEREYLKKVIKEIETEKKNTIGVCR